MSKEYSLEIEKVDDNFETWIDQPFVSDEIRPELQQATILMIPIIGFRNEGEPTFWVGTESVLAYFRQHLPAGVTIDICIDDEKFKELSLNSNYIRIGAFIVTSLLLPVFTNVLSDYIYEKIQKDVDSKPPIQIINIDQSRHDNIVIHQNNEASNKPIPPKAPPLPKKYMEPPKVKFSVTVVDSINGKSIKYDYEGPASEVPKMTDEMKKLSANETD